MRYFLIKIMTFLFNPSYQIIFLYRIQYYLHKNHIKIIPTIIKYYIHILYSCDISVNAIIGKNLNLAHAVGIVIGNNAIIGDNVTIFQNVTLGSHGKRDLSKSYPIIHDNCTIYAGAVIIGGIVIGKNSIIGANAVVLKDVPENSIAVGIPAECKTKKREK